MRKVVAVTCHCVAVTLTTTVISHAAERLCPPAGTVIENSVGSRIRFTESTDPYCNYVDTKGEPRLRWRSLWPASSRLVKEGGAELSKLWPLEVGKKVTVTYSEGAGAWHFTYTILRRELVSVPAGQFDTFVIEQEERGIANGPGYRGFLRHWYAPELGYYVKQEFVIESGTHRNPPANFVATAVRVPNAAK
jgi:hypothetical protein